MSRHLALYQRAFINLISINDIDIIFMRHIQNANMRAFENEFQM